MTFIVDIEANQQPITEVLSIGIVDENGNEYYSLVKPKHKIQPIIRSLTKITDSMVATAPTPNEVLAQIKEYLNKCGSNFDNKDTFIVYGSEDTKFLKAFLYQKIDESGKLLINYMRSHLCDYSNILNKEFGIDFPVRLTAALSFLRGEEITPIHNALEDAKMLAEVVDLTKKHEFSKNDSQELFSNHIAQNRKRNGSLPTVYKNIQQLDAQGNFLNEFHSLNEAYKWLSENDETFKSVKHHNPQRTKEHLKQKLKEGKTYYGYTWKLGEKK